MTSSPHATAINIAAVVSVLYGSIGVCVVHLYTVWLIHSAHGWGWAIVSFATPLLSDVVWLGTEIFHAHLGSAYCLLTISVVAALALAWQLLNGTLRR